MRTLVVLPCSLQKRVDAPHSATANGLADPERPRQAGARLAAFPSPALEIHAATHHPLVMEGVQAVRQRLGREALDVAVLPASHGLLRTGDEIIPPGATIDEFDQQALAGSVVSLENLQQVAVLVSQFELAFYLLSGRDLSALDLPLDRPGSVQQIVLTDQDSLDLVPPAPNLHAFVADGSAAARRWHVKATQVRGFLFRRLCYQVVSHGPIVLEWLCQHPQDIELLFYKTVRWRPQLPLW